VNGSFLEQGDFLIGGLANAGYEVSRAEKSSSVRSHRGSSFFVRGVRMVTLSADSGFHHHFSTQADKLFHSGRVQRSAGFDRVVFFRGKNLHA